MVALGCSDSGSSSGCNDSGASSGCNIDEAATVCGDRITITCLDGETPEAEGQCAKAIEQDEEAIYCCTSAVDGEDVAPQVAEDPRPEAVRSKTPRLVE